MSSAPQSSARILGKDISNYIGQHVSVVGQAQGMVNNGQVAFKTADGADITIISAPENVVQQDEQGNPVFSFIEIAGIAINGNQIRADPGYASLFVWQTWEHSIEPLNKDNEVELPPFDAAVYVNVIQVGQKYPDILG